MKGPEADRKGPEEHFVIVGAGVAGLTSALLLLQAGHRYQTPRCHEENMVIVAMITDKCCVDCGMMLPWHFLLLRLLKLKIMRLVQISSQL